MPLDSRATQTTATNSATYLVNKRRRVFGTEISAGTGDCALFPVACGRGAKSRFMRSRILIPATLPDRSGTPEDAAHASNAIGLDDHCSGHPRFDASLLRLGALQLYVEELAERVLLHLFNFRLASARLGMLRAPLLWGVPALSSLARI